MMIRLIRSCAALCVSIGVLACSDGAPEDLGGEASRSHQWGNYHWARTANPFTLVVLNSLTSDWEDYLPNVLELWAQKNGVLELTAVESLDDPKTRKQCTAPLGAIRVCNAEYGYTGWLGVAGISVDSALHITRGYTKLNDTYFAGAHYNNPTWRQAVLCQELGHDFGLDHQDEVFDNEPLFTCMDYQEPPTPKPNTHDYEELGLMYAHLDSYATVGTSVDPGVACKGKGCKGAEASWGALLRQGPRSQVWARELPDGGRELTFVRLVE